MAELCGVLSYPNKNLVYFKELPDLAKAGWRIPLAFYFSSLVTFCADERTLCLPQGLTRTWRASNTNSLNTVASQPLRFVEQHYREGVIVP